MRTLRNNSRRRLTTPLLCVIAWAMMAAAGFALRSPPPRTTTSILDRRVEHLDCRNVNLAAVIQALQKQTGAKIDVDLNGYSDFSLPLNLHVESAKLGDVLKVLFFTERPGRIFIKAHRNNVELRGPRDYSPAVRIYDVSDLVAAHREFLRGVPPEPQISNPSLTAPIDPFTDELRNQIIDVLVHFRRAPIMGSPNNVDVCAVNRRLIVTAGKSEHELIAETLEKLRHPIAKGRPKLPPHRPEEGWPLP